MINPAPTFICNSGMRTAIYSRPIVDGMTGCTVQTKHSCMICRIAMATRTRCGKINKLSTRMASLACNADVSTCQREVAAIMIEISILPI